MRLNVYAVLLLALLFPQVSFAKGLDFGTLKATPMMVEKIILEDKDTVPIMFGESATLKAITFPENQTVVWKVEPDIESEAEVSHSTGGDTVTITALEESGSGWVNVEASLAGGVPIKSKIYVGCQTCTDGVCNVVGSGTVNIGSVEISISLGKAEEGMGAGDLFIKAEKPSLELFTPVLLEVSTLSENVKPIYQKGILKQINTPQSLVIVEPDSEYSYEILFFSKQDVGDLKEGLYQVKPFSDPITAWRIENPHGSSDRINEILVTEFRTGSEKRYEYSYSEQENTWSLASGNGLKLETRKEYINGDGNRVERTTIKGDDGIPVSVVEKIYREFEWGEELISQTSDPDGDSLTTTYRYNEPEGNGYSKVASRINPDGYWTRYEYDGEGRRIKTITPWLDTPGNSDESKTRVTINDYTPLSGDAAEDKDHHRPRTVTVITNGIITSRDFNHYSYTNGNERVEIQERCVTQQCSYGDKKNLRTTITYYAKSDKPESQKIKSRRNPDGTLTSYFYEAGTFSPSPAPDKAVFSPGEGTAIRKTTIQGTADHPGGIPQQTTKQTSISDWLGNTVMQEQFVKTNEGYERISWSYNSYNKLGRIVETLHSNRTRTESGWSCCGKANSTDINGITTRYGYDDLKRTTIRINEATGVSTEYTYDAAGRQLSSTDKNGNLSRTQINRFDLTGRLLESTDPAGLVTSYIYNSSETTVIRPGGAEEITITYPDGKIRSVTGSGVIDRFYHYGINPDGSHWTTVFIAKDNGPRWEKTTRDLLGRIICTEKPGYSTIQVSTSSYDHAGRLSKTVTTGQPDTLYEYDEIGRPFRNGIDIDGNNRLDLASMDRIQQNTTTFRKREDSWWQEQENRIYANETSDSPTRISANSVRLTGWSDRIVHEQIGIDINGNKTVSQESINRHERKRIRITIYPDSPIPASQFYLNNLLMASISKTGVKTTYGYDALGRRISITDPRTGTAITHYNNNHRVDYIEDAAGNRTGFIYDRDSGFKTTDINPMGKKTFYHYTSHGQLGRTWGDVPYPVEYRYNDHGEMVELYTFRTHPMWNEEQWPEDVAGDTTAWSYHEATGLLLAKEDAKGYGASYTYDQTNRLATRTWARGITTTYRYLPTGELQTIDYSDDTADIGFTYDRIGRKTTVTDILGTRKFSYNDTLQRQSEEVEGIATAVINRFYDELGRNSGFSVGKDYRVHYTFDDRGRFSTLEWKVQNQSGATSYSYLPDTNLLAGYTSGKNATTYEYEPHRNLKTAVTNTSNGTPVSRYEYQYDRLARRINLKNSGNAFTEAAFTLYDYNDRNEVQTSSRFHGADLTDQTKPDNSRQRYYHYDPIGNRLRTLAADQQTGYQSNELNQYTQTSGSSNGSLAYDLDGNLAELKKNTTTTRYLYNGENRLTAVEPTIPREHDTSSIFVYDYMGRRVEKKVFILRSNSWNLKTHTSFIYDGWNLIAEIDKITNKETNYVWGLDLSQSLQGAGGIGGLLARVDDSNVYSYFYDANGNVGQLVNQEEERVAAYEYDPFGNTITIGGRLAGANPFRFSTKYFDAESGLYYYGYRFYLPELGRWLNKDPIQEDGGLNLYGFVGNDGVNKHDILGLDFIAVGTRNVVFNGPGMNHLSIHFFTENPPCTKKDSSFKYGQEPNNSSHAESRELLARKWYYQDFISLPDPDVNVSIIYKGNYDKNLEKLKVIYSDADVTGNSTKSPSAKAKWAIITKAADSYKYALHFPLPNQLDNSNWPHVAYGIHPFNPTNSNTFVREMVRSIGEGGTDGDVFWQMEIGADTPDMPNVRFPNLFPKLKSNRP